MEQEKAFKCAKKQCKKPTIEGDDTMSAVAQNYVYQVGGKKDTKQKEPTVTKDRMAKIKASVGKYLTDKK